MEVGVGGHGVYSVACGIVPTVSKTLRPAVAVLLTLFISFFSVLLCFFVFVGGFAGGGHSYLLTHTHAHTHTRTHTHARTHTHTHTHTHTRAHARAHTHRDEHTHTLWRAHSPTRACPSRIEKPEI